MIRFIRTILSRHSAENKNGDYVMIFHGIARTSRHMKGLQRYLSGVGYDVINMDYPSRHHDLKTLVTIVHQALADRLIKDKPVHFVGYSMGGLLVRALLNTHRPARLGRVVQLASPNKGSEVADFARNNRLFQSFYGPAGQQLGTKDNEALAALLGSVNYELGIIAGNRTIDPISSLIIGRENDGKVAVDSTKLKEMKDFIVVPATHTFFPNNKTVQHQTFHFLQNGEFKR